MAIAPSERDANDLSGYLHPAYAESLAEFGTPYLLPASGGWLLKRPVPGVPYQDAMGCYPLFACRDWSQLGADLADIRTDLVSLALVADPFGIYEYTTLKRCFDTVSPFKDHFIIDLSLPLRTFVSAHHRYRGRKARRVQSWRWGEDDFLARSKQRFGSRRVSFTFLKQVYELAI